MGKKLRVVFTGVLGMSMALSSLGVVSAAPTAKDIKGHWAEERLQEWIDKGYIQGYQNGTVQPNREITRAEFVAMINRVFDYTETSSVKYKDLPAGNWAHTHISKAVQAGYIKGYTDNTIRPNAKISRQESAAMIARILGLTAESNASLTFKDANKIAAWSKGSVAAVAAKDIVNGYPNGTFGPERHLTRAEAVAMIRNALTNRPAQAIIYDKAGSYGSATLRQTLTGNVTISTSGVTLQNMDITGDLILGEGIGQGDVTLNNVKVNGKTFVYGGGGDTVNFMDSTLGDVIVDKKTGTVRIIAGGSTSIQNTTVESPATLVEQNLTGSGFTDVELSKELAANALVTLSGSFNNVNVLASSVQLHLIAGTIQTLTIASGATNVTIRLDSGTNVAKLVLDTIAKVVGTGSIEMAVIADSAKGTTFETKPKATEGSGSTTAPGTGTTPPSGGSSGGGSGGSGGGGNGGGGTTPPIPEVPTPVTPTISTYGVRDVTTVTADVYLTFNDDGKAYYVALPDDAKAPTVSQVIEGQDADGKEATQGAGNVEVSNGKETVTKLEGLNADTSYAVYLVAVNKMNKNSELKVVEFTTKAEDTGNPGDTEKPVIRNSGVDDTKLMTTTASVYFESSEAGTAYYTVVEATYDVPTAEDILKEKGITINADERAAINLEDLASGTEYVVYVLVQDAANNTSEIKAIPFITKKDNNSDENDPVVSDLGSNRTSTVTGDVYFTSNEDARAYYVILATGAKTPTIKEVIAGEYEDGEAFDKDMMGNMFVTKDVKATVELDKLLNEGQEYTAYIVVRDASGNESKLEKIVIPAQDTTSNTE